MPPHRLAAPRRLYRAQSPNNPKPKAHTSPKKLSVADLSLVRLKQNLHIFCRPAYGAR